MRIRKVLFITALVAFVSHLSAVDFKCSFGEGKWNAADWLIMKSPRWDYVGLWIQQADHIANKVPADAGAEEMLSRRAGETYTSMILKNKFSGSVAISSTMSFAHRMAPLIVITNEYGKDSDGRPEHREHFEIVLYDKGLNVWHHYFKDGKPHWRKSAFMDAEFKPDVKYTLSVKIQFKGKGAMMTVSAGGKSFGFFDESLPENFHVGITGCEGINRFYDFSVKNIN
ncbi:MAG: hypothetical protein A2020_02665 [Lentisphaerae bacterium GWF2_45_14]|nr:MAG: hypothetical protein A2020_02665 [Lentisphaerae bacterium GWF2_45_14]